MRMGAGGGGRSSVRRADGSKFQVISLGWGYLDSVKARARIDDREYPAS